MLKQFDGIRRHDPRPDCPVIVTVLAGSWAEAQKRMAENWNAQRDNERDHLSPRDFDLMNVRRPTPRARNA